MGQFPSWTQISSGLQAAGTAAEFIAQAASALKKTSTAPTVTTAQGNIKTVSTSKGSGDSSMLFALLGVGALLLLKR